MTCVQLLETVEDKQAVYPLYCCFQDVWVENFPYLIHLKEKLRESLDNMLDIQDIHLWWLYLILKDNWYEINDHTELIKHHFSW